MSAPRQGFFNLLSARLRLQGSQDPLAQFEWAKSGFVTKYGLRIFKSCRKWVQAGKNGFSFKA
jgi:hypothetical protein